MSKILSWLAIFISVFLIGCVSGYKEFYQPVQGLDYERIAKRRVLPAPITPLVERSQPADGDTILKSYIKRGYFMIGQSSFNSGRSESEDAAIKQAKDVNADLVLIINPKYTGSISSVVPITRPKTTTSYSSGSATAYGSNGSVTAYGNSVTTTNSQTTDYVPITVHRSDYAALYFVKQKISLGLYFRELSDDERQSLQSNKGAVVEVVVDGSPAYEADVLTGDIITKVDGINLINPEYLSEYIKTRPGKNISLTIIRHGQTLQKSIQLNS